MTAVLNLDMDGVLSDFEGYVQNLYGSIEEFRTKGKQFWNKDVIQRRAFANLDPLVNVEWLVNLLKGFRFPLRILTSTGGGKYHHEIAQQKLDWLTAQGVRQVPIAFCAGSSEKHLFCTPGDLLVDDHKSNCDRWLGAGGVAYHFAPEGPSTIQSYGDIVGAIRNAHELYEGQ